MHLILAIAAIFLSGLLVGCDKLDQIADDLVKLGTGVQNSALQATDAVKELTKVAEKLPAESAKVYGPMIEQVTTRATQDAGIQARCTMDFARARLAKDIQYVAAVIRTRNGKKGKLPEAVPTSPQICSVSPKDFRRDEFQQQSVTWDGYDLDSKDKSSVLGLQLRHRDNRIEVVDDALVVNSNYVATATLSRLSQLPDTAVELWLVRGDQVLSRVGIKEPPAPVEESQTVRLDPWGPLTAIDCGKTRKIQVSNPRGGKNGMDDPGTREVTLHPNRDFEGHGPKVNWSVTLELIRNAGGRGTGINARVKYHAIEWDADKSREQSDFTEACGEWTVLVYTCPTDWNILSIDGKSDDAGEYIDTDYRIDEASGSLYTSYHINGDGSGDDAGIRTTIQAPVQGSVRIKLRKPAQ